MVDTRGHRYSRMYSSAEKYALPGGAEDRRRILYCPAFRRLAGVTQVVSPAEGQVFHNRLSHTLRVAHVARRIAEWLLVTEPGKAGELGVDPDVVECAALAHDLGHPPFGHVAEEQLNKLIQSHGFNDGFEGNAQSFRIVSKLAVWGADHPGLNLTAATLNAILKYPWLRGPHGKRSRKFGAYLHEQPEFEFARHLGPENGRRTLEAEAMDLADDIAYALHDLEDFYRAGVIPLELLSSDTREQKDFLDHSFRRLKEEGGIGDLTREKFAKRFGNMLYLLPFDRRYSGHPEQDYGLRLVTDVLEQRYIANLKLKTKDSSCFLHLPEGLRMELAVLKELVWYYVIDSPQLATQQYGKAQAIKFLFETYLDALESGKWATVLPSHRREQLAQLSQATEIEAGERVSNVRLVADYISSLTDAEAHCMHLRLRGIDSGRFTDRMPL